MKLTRAQYVDNLEQANTASFKPWVYASIACSSIGLGFTSLWCLVMGHTEAFIPPATLDDPFANPRLFFLIGALLCSVFYIAMPGQLRQHDTKLRVILPVLGAVGTVAFALPTQGPVSYTHLDVYKRQPLAFWMALFQPQSMPAQMELLAS